MNKFTYTLPSGKRFTMTTPDSVTQAQADVIFYGQVAAGALAGFVAGQTKSSVPTQAVKFLLSRLDRGTAGVDDRVILSIVNGIPNITGLPTLINVPLENPITQGDLVNIGFDNSYTPPAIGPLNPSQVQGLLAQISNYVGQASDEMTDTTGVGLYGFDCQQLEQAGYVKPGTYRQFIFDPEPLTSVLSAPGIWTGKDGINSADEFLNDPVTQNKAMTTLLQQSYSSLTANGTITPPFAPPVTAVVGQVFTQSGLQTVSQLSAATGISLPVPTNLVPALSNTNIASLISTPLTNVGSLASGALNIVGGSLPNVNSIASSLSNTVTGGVAALISNGSIFGTSAVTQWANSGSLDQLIGGGGIAGGQVLGTLTGGLTNNLTGSLTSLTNNITGLDVLGKASQFASSFSNPLTSLSNLGNFNLSSLTSGLPDISSLTNLSSTLTGSLSGLASNLTGSLTGLVSGQLSSITGALSGQLGSLTSSLGSLGNFSSLASLPGLGSLGDIGGLFGGGGDALVSSVQVAPGYSNTVNRAEVDVAFGKILGSAKIPRPSFDYPSPGSISLGANGDIAFAQNALASLQGIGNKILELGTTVFNPNETASA